MSLRHGKRTIIVNVDTKPELFDEVPCLGSSIPDAASMNIHYTGPSDWIIEELCFHETTHLYVPDTYTEDDVEALTAALLSVKRIMEASGVRKEET